MICSLVLAASAFAPSPMLPVHSPTVHMSTPVAMSAAGLGRRAAFLGLAALPLAAHADAIADIAARNAAAAEAAKTPEALAAIKQKDDDQENGQVVASAGITLFLAAATLLSFPASGTDQNVKRLAKKVATGKGRNYDGPAKKGRGRK